MDDGSRLFRDVARGVASLAALTALLAGVPIGLLSVAGWPLPTSMPHWSAVMHALGQSEVADSTLLKGAALVGFVAWAVLVACVVVEAMAWAAGRTAARLPVVAPFQVWAGRLVASALLMLSSVVGLVRPVAAAPVGGRAPVARVVSASSPTLQVIAPSYESPEEAAAAARPALPTPPGAKRYIVDPPDGRHRDTLWGIAERHLGNPERWPEIFQLNKDRVSAGHRLTNPHWIYAGEELIMPADAVGLDPVAAPAAPAPPAPPAAPGPSVAPAPSAPPAPSVVPAPSETPVPATGSPLDMSVIPDDEPAPQAAPSPVAKASTGWRLARTVTDLLPARAPTADLAAGGIFAAGVVVALERKRRRRQRRHRPGDPFLVPDQGLATMEMSLRTAADLDARQVVDIALKLLSRDAPDAQVLGIRVGSRQVAIHFVETPSSVSPPFRVVGEGWVLPRRSVTEKLAADLERAPSAALPLVTLGETDDGETVLLNVVAARCTAVAGSRATAGAFLSTAAAELATSDWIERGRVVAVGLGDDLAALAGVRAVNTLADVGVVERGDVVVSALPPGALVGALPAGAALLAVGPANGFECRVVIGGERLEVDRLDVVVRPQVLAEDDFEQIVDLLEGGDDLIEHEEVEVETTAVEDPLPSESRLCDPAEVEVRVMGPIEIVGAEKSLARAKSIELVVYLAVHREALVDADRLREALWPGRPPGTTLYTTASVARSHLGRASNGEHHLPLLPNGERLYRLAKSVGTDYDRFHEAVQRAKGESAVDAMRTLRDALALVRGRPFDVASRGFAWTHVEGFQVCLENEIAAAAHQLARLCLEAGDAEGARWATRQGLRASPGNEQLYRDEMEAADLEGNPAGVEALMKELSHIVEEDSPFESLHPETVALYHRLMRTPS